MSRRKRRSRRRADPVIRIDAAAIARAERDGGPRLTGPPTSGNAANVRVGGPAAYISPPWIARISLMTSVARLRPSFTARPTAGQVEAARNKARIEAGETFASRKPSTWKRGGGHSE